MQASTKRVETFSDGVIAIIITIMILELKLPAFKNPANEDIEAHVIKILPHLGAYVFSFIMLGIIWMNHHHFFNLLERTDNFLLALNLLLLFWMSLIPFVTGIMGENPLLPLSTALYGGVLLLTTLTFSYMRYYTLKNELVHTDEQRDINLYIKKLSRKNTRKNYIATGAYLLSIPLAFVNVYFSFICFLTPIVIFMLPGGIEEGKLADKVIEKNS